MLKTLEAVIEKDGNVRLLEEISLTGRKRALVTILDEETVAESTLLSEAALAQDWLRNEEDEAWLHLQQEP